MNHDEIIYNRNLDTARNRCIDFKQVNTSLLLYESYANESSQICPFLAVRPQFESVHHQNRRLSSHSYSHESVILFVFLGLIFVTAHAKMSHLSARFLRTYEPHLHCTDILFEIEVPPVNESLVSTFPGGTSISKSMSVHCRCDS